MHQHWWPRRWRAVPWRCACSASSAVFCLTSCELLRCQAQAAALPWQAATKVDLPLVDQAPQPKRQGFLVAGKGNLLGGDPGDLMLRDHTTRDGLQKDFPDCHESHVTTSLHAVVPGLAPWLERATSRSRQLNQPNQPRQEQNGCTAANSVLISADLPIGEPSPYCKG